MFDRAPIAGRPESTVHLVRTLNLDWGEPMSARRPILGWFASIFFGALVASTPASAQDRGELLYSTHCGTCHTTQMHWRAGRAATDWPTLKAQVRRWQGAASLAWTEEDVLAVARYLNDAIYHFEQRVESSTAARLLAEK